MRHVSLFLLAALAAGCRTAPPAVPMAAEPVQDRTLEQLEADLRFTERQITELYGPLAYLVQEGRVSVMGFLKVLGRNFIFPMDGSIIQGKDRTAWLYWAENDLFPRNQRIRDLIKSKAHLIEGGRIPPSFVQLLEHQQSWAMLHEYWRSKRVEYPLHSQTSWPGRFNADVLDTYAALKKRHASLLRDLSRVGSTPDQRGAERAFVERQLENLYGPLAALNEEGTVAMESFLKGLGRDTVIPKEGKLSEAELKKWIFWMEQDILPRHRNRWGLLRGNMLLLDGAALPKSHLDFISHYLVWNTEHQFWRKKQVEYSWQPRTPWPAKFHEDIAATYARLKARHAELLGRPSK